MKARVKATGEIINIAEYAKVTLDRCDSFGDPLEFPFDEVQIINETTIEELEARHAILLEQSDMPSEERMRYELTKTAMHAILTGDFYKRYTIRDDLQYGGVANEAINIADEIIKQLKESEVEK